MTAEELASLLIGFFFLLCGAFAAGFDIGKSAEHEINERIAARPKEPSDG